MPVGAGQEILRNVPSQSFVVDPDLFNALTRRNIFQAYSIQDPGPGNIVDRQLPQVGIISKVRVVFEGTLVIATAAATTSADWPYGILDSFTLTAQGQNDLISCDGLDLTALRFSRFPAYQEKVDTFPDVVGGGGSVAVGSYLVHATWEVPVAIDDQTLIGSLYAQSAATNIRTKFRSALMSRLFATNPGNASWTGANWFVELTDYAVPYDAKGNLVIPDLSKLHTVNAISLPMSGTGEQRAPLIRTAGMLERLFISASANGTTRLSALPNAATSKKIDALRLEYGGNERPMVWNPASLLLSKNNEHYFQPLPYDRLCVDQIRENPKRDAILLQGVTELAVVPTIDSGVTVTNGSIRVVQESLL